MRYLLDTHALLWALTDPAKLSVRARDLIRDPASALVVSSVSAWEIATKWRLGRMPQADVLIAAYGRHLNRLGAARMPIGDEHALLSGTLDWEHRDPFDRVLAAQAILESLTLVTKDGAFAGLSGLATFW